MSRLFKRLTLVVATLLCLFVPAAAYAAYNPLDSACHAGGGVANNSSACTADSSKDPITGPNGVLRHVTLLLGLMGGIVAVIILIISGFRYVISNGDAQKAANARSSALGAVIGMVIIAVATSVIVFVVSKL